MKFELGYAGDSSDGEEQEEKEDLYLEDKNYISYIQDGIKFYPYQYEYIFKDIGGRLLHHKIVSSKYFKNKTSYYSLLKSDKESISALKSKVSESTRLIDDKYIVGKLIASSFDLKKEAEEYLKCNKQNIKDLVVKDFKLILEEEIFLEQLKKLVESLDGIFDLDDFEDSTPNLYKVESLDGIFDLDDFKNSIPNLYKYLLNNWENITGVITSFSINPNDEIIGKFQQELYSLITKDALNLILQEHTNTHRQQIISSPKAQVAYFIKNIFADRQIKAVKYLLEQEISNLGLFAASDDASDFLAKVRKYHKLMRGILKHTLLENDPLPKHKLCLTIKVGTAIDRDILYPDLGKLQIDEVHKFYRSGAKTVMVLGSTGRLGASYKGLLPDIKQLASKSDLSSWFKEILKGQISQEEDWNTFTPQEQHYLYDLTFLLFCCETTRNVSAFLTNAMFFDLLSQDYYQIEQLTTLLPVAMEKAVPSSIKSNYTFGPKYGETKGLLSSVLYYDLRLKAKDDDIKELDQRTKKLFTDWFFFSKILNKASVTKFVELTSQNSIRDLEEAMSSEVITNLQDKTQLITNIIDQPFCVTKSEYTANLTMAARGTKLITKIEIEQVPAKAFAELIHDWYGLEIPYLGEGVIIWGSE